MSGIVAENGQLVTGEMIECWESALEHDEWPSGWKNCGEIVEGRLPNIAIEATSDTGYPNI